MKQTGSLGGLGVQPKLGGHDGADVGHLAGVLQQVLSVGGAVFHAADHPHELDVESMDAEVDAGPLSCLEDFLLELFLDLGHYFLNPGGMDPAVHDKLVQREPGDLPADGIKGGEKNGVRSVVHDYLDSCGGLEGPDVTTLTANNTSLNLVIFNRERGHRILYGCLGGGPLDCVYDYAFGLL